MVSRAYTQIVNLLPVKVYLFFSHRVNSAPRFCRGVSKDLVPCNDLFSLTAKIKRLIEKDKQLDGKIQNLQENDGEDAFFLQRLKKEKRAIQEAIQKLSSQVFPDNIA